LFVDSAVRKVSPSLLKSLTFSSFPTATMVNTIVPSAHALRNPTRPVQVSRPQKAGPSDASKATQVLLAAQIKQCKIEPATEVNKFDTYRTEKIADMALCFNKKEHEIRVLLCNTSQLKAHCKPSVRKAVLHQRSLDLQEEDALFC
jgi:hypothetical protein